MSVVDSSFDHPLKQEERASLPFMGGFMNHGYQCGMIWGATLAAGAQAYQLLGPGLQADAAAIIAAQRVVESFRARYKHINCFEITEVEFRPSSKRRLLLQIFKFFIKKGGPIGCFSMAAGYPDCNDAGRLKQDPVLKLMCDRDPIMGDDLGSQPTLSRFENSVSRRELIALGYAFADLTGSHMRSPSRAGAGSVALMRRSVVFLRNATS